MYFFGGAAEWGGVRGGHATVFNRECFLGTSHIIYIRHVHEDW